VGRFGVTSRLGVCASAAVAALAAACRLGGAPGASPPAAASAPAPLSVPGPVRGRVVDRQTRGALAGRTVMIGGRSATTAADGSFAFADVPGVYDLAVVDAKRDVVSIYRRLTRRDPLLVHGGAPEKLDEYRARHSAKLFGSFTVGGRPLASGAATLGFFSPALAALADPCPAAPATPCDPLALYWNRPASLDGEAFAIAIEDRGPRSADPSRSTEALSAWAARRPFTVTASAAPTVDLALAPMPARRVRADFRVPAGRDVSTLIESYRLPLPGAEIPLRRYDRDGLRGLDDELPDLGGLGASLCLTALSDGDGTAWATQCGVGAAPITLTLETPPRLTAPANASSLEPDTAFAWSPFAGGVQVLELLGAGPAADRPDVTIYTTETRASWQQTLAATTVAFPKGCSIYQVTAGGYGPFRSMDDAVGPAGLGASVAAETRWSQSPPITVTVPRWPRAQPGTFEAKLCHYPYARGIVCDGESSYPGLPETYVLSAINNKLRQFPEFTKAIGIYCVRDCETARRFMKAYSNYSSAHPGFDRNQPLDMESC
jgi:hypothetical protein